jgi:hypothetical protein
MANAYETGCKHSWAGRPVVTPDGKGLCVGKVAGSFRPAWLVVDLDVGGTGVFDDFRVKLDVARADAKGGA